MNKKIANEKLTEYNNTYSLAEQDAITARTNKNTLLTILLGDCVKITNSVYDYPDFNTLDYTIIQKGNVKKSGLYYQLMKLMKQPDEWEPVKEVTNLILSNNTLTIPFYLQEINIDEE